MTTPPDDIALMLNYQSTGDVSAFETLFARHKDDLLTFLVRLSGSRTIAEDVSQQAWLRIIDIAREGRYEQAEAAFRTYLYTIARNRYFDEFHRKHEERRTDSLDAMAHDGAALGGTDPPLEQALDAAESARRLHDALARLPLEQREVIALWANGMPIRAMAEITGAPRETVLSRKKYALKKLRGILAATGWGDTG